MRNLVFTLFLLAAACPAQSFEPVASMPDWVSVEANVPYDTYKETVLDILQPKTASAGKRAGMLVIHGGGWVGGTKEQVVEDFCLPFVEKGFVVANVEYRLAKVALAPAAVMDVLRAADWFQRNAGRYNVDRKRIAAIGNSAGAHLALMVGMTPKSAKLGPTGKVNAVVNIYGVTDVADQLGGPNTRDYAVTWVPDEPGRLELARRVSPISYVRKDLPPILTVHGDADETVPYEHGTNLTKALRQAGAPAEMISVPRGKHGFSKEQWAGILPQIFGFLQRHGILP